MRPTVSDALPAANGTTMVSGRSGHSPVDAFNDEIVTAPIAANAMPTKRADMIEADVGEVVEDAEKSRRFEIQRVHAVDRSKRDGPLRVFGELAHARPRDLPDAHLREKRMSDAQDVGAQ